MKRLFQCLALFVGVVTLMTVGNTAGMAGVVTKRFDSIPSGFSSEEIAVKFLEGAAVETPEKLLPADLQAEVEKISPQFSIKKDNLKSLKSQGEYLSGKKLPNLSLWYKIKLKPGTDPVEFMNRLLQAGIVEHAEPTPLPAPLPATTPDFTSQQGYLAPSPDGIDAEYAWAFPGGDGSPVRIYDVEYSWDQTHEDLARARSVVPLLNPGDSAVDPFTEANHLEHGTAVLGELIATDDSKGVTGIAYGAQIGLAPANTAKLGYNVANAILLAVANAKRGDVILIEQQTCVCKQPCPPKSQKGFGPSEWFTPVFEAIQTATGNGITVVEAAGNGAVDLDQPSCSNYFNPNVQDSGAIIVGAGVPPGELDRYPEVFTSYGSRVNVQAWGSKVVTTGYGDLYKNPDDPTNIDFWYTNTFGGTSGASPIVTGAAADLQGIAVSSGTMLTPGQIRSILIETGSPQQGDTARQHIGPRPSLYVAINQLTAGSISGTVTDSGGSPIAGINMALSGAKSTATVTGFDGTYYFSGLANGSCTVKPSSREWTFAPATINVNVTGKVTGQNFTGTSASSYSCQIAAKTVSGNAPFQVQFTSKTTGISTVKSRFWNFGDGQTGAGQNPAHIYRAPGTYSVSLTVTGASAGEQATAIKKDYITVNAVPKAGFTATPRNGKAPLTVQFTDGSTGASSWLWNFGDRNTSTEQNPAHTYNKAGAYTVTLSVKGPGGTNKVTYPKYIKVTK